MYSYSGLLRFRECMANGMVSSKMVLKTPVWAEKSNRGATGVVPSATAATRRIGVCRLRKETCEQRRRSATVAKKRGSAVVAKIA